MNLGAECLGDRVANAPRVPPASEDRPLDDDVEHTERLRDPGDGRPAGGAEHPAAETVEDEPMDAAPLRDGRVRKPCS